MYSSPEEQAIGGLTFLEGRTARRAGVWLSDNPWSVSPMFQQWAKGWEYEDRSIRTRNPSKP